MSAHMSDDVEGRPIPFITLTFDERKQPTYTVTDEAKEALSHVAAPICVVSVVGMYRTGKSFLLNRILLGKRKGFPVGATVNACTKGLWIWNKPLEGTDSNGNRVSVIVVDTEGLGALDANTQNDCCIFALALLTSSYFLYNSVGTINESALENLSLVVNLTKYIRTKSASDDGDEDGSSFGSYFPRFLWVVRDFSLQLIDENGAAITSKHYLENALREIRGFSEKVQSKNRVRAMIRAFFEDRDCFPLVRPVEDESLLQSLCSAEDEKLRPEFRAQMHTLRRRVFTTADAKTLEGTPLSGAMLVALAESYVGAVNEGQVPSIKDAWSNVCESACRTQLRVSLALFKDAARHLEQEALPMAESELQERLDSAADEAAQAFRTATATMGREAEGFAGRLVEEMAEQRERVVASNRKAAAERVEALLRDLFGDLEAKLAHGQLHDWQAFEKLLPALVPAFAAVDPERTALQAQFLQEAEGLAGAGQRLAKQMEKLLSVAGRRMTETLERMMQEAEREHVEELKRLRADGRADKHQLEMKVGELELRAANENRRREEGEEREKELREELRGEMARRETEVERERERLQGLERRGEEERAALVRARAAAADAETAARGAAQDLQRAQAELARAEERAEEEGEAARVRAGELAEAEARAAQAEEEGARLQRAMAAEGERVRRAEGEVRAARGAVEALKGELQGLRAEAGALRAEKERLEQEGADVERVEGAIRRLQEEGAGRERDLQADVWSLRQELEAVQADRDEALRRLEELEAGGEGVREVSAPAGEWERMEREMAAMREELERAREESMVMADERERAAETSRFTQSRLQTMLEEREEREEEREGEVRAAVQRAEAAERALAEAEAAREAALAAAEHLQRTVGALQSEERPPAAMTSTEAVAARLVTTLAARVEEMADVLAEKALRAHGGARSGDLIGACDGAEGAVERLEGLLAGMRRSDLAEVRGAEAAPARGQQRPRNDAAAAQPPDEARARARAAAVTDDEVAGVMDKVSMWAHRAGPGRAERGHGGGGAAGETSNSGEHPRGPGAGSVQSALQEEAEDSREEPATEELEARVAALEQNMLRGSGDTAAGEVAAQRQPPLVVRCRITEARQVEGRGKGFTLYDVAVELASGALVRVSRRYSEFAELHRKLLRLFPHQLQPAVTTQVFTSRWFRNKLDPALVTCRRAFLEEYLQCLLTNSHFERSRQLRAFLAAQLPPPTRAAPASSVAPSSVQGGDKASGCSSPASKASSAADRAPTLNLDELADPSQVEDPDSFAASFGSTSAVRLQAARDSSYLGTAAGALLATPPQSMRPAQLVETPSPAQFSTSDLASGSLGTLADSVGAVQGSAAVDSSACGLGASAPLNAAMQQSAAHGASTTAAARRSGRVTLQAGGADHRLSMSTLLVTPFPITAESPGLAKTLRPGVVVGALQEV